MIWGIRWKIWNQILFDTFYPTDNLFNPIQRGGKVINKNNGEGGGGGVGELFSKKILVGNNFLRKYAPMTSNPIMYHVNKEKTRDLQWFYTLQGIVHNKTRTSSNTNKQKSIIKKYNPPPSRQTEVNCTQY